MENNSNTEQKWYDKTWLVVLLCLFFFPVGLYALWKNTSISKGWKLAVTVIIALMVVAGMSGDDSSTATSNNTETTVQPKKQLTQAQKDSIAAEEKTAVIEERKGLTVLAEDLVYNYVENEVSADNIFKDKKFYVEGYIDDIGKDILDNIYVTLKSDDNFRNVQCYIDDSDLVAVLRKGQKITVFGRCDGLLINVKMKDCVLVKNLEDL